MWECRFCVRMQDKFEEEVDDVVPLAVWENFISVNILVTKNGGHKQSLFLMGYKYLYMYSVSQYFTGPQHNMGCKYKFLCDLCVSFYWHIYTLGCRIELPLHNIPLHFFLSWTSSLSISSSAISASKLSNHVLLGLPTSDNKSTIT